MGVVGDFIVVKPPEEPDLSAVERQRLAEVDHDDAAEN